MELNKSFTYDSKTGRWHLELAKAQKDVFSQGGLKITIDPGFPTLLTLVFQQVIQHLFIKQKNNQD